MPKPKQVNAELLREKLLTEIDRSSGSHADGLIQALEILTSLTVPNRCCDFRNPGWEARRDNKREFCSCGEPSGGHSFCSACDPF